MRPPSRSAALVVALVAALAGLLTGCQGEPRELAPTDAPSSTASPTPSAPTASGGVELTDGGTELSVGEPATVVLRRGDREGAVEVALLAVTRGAAADLADFSLDQTAAASVPWYVRVRVTDRGEGALGGAALPLTAQDSTGRTVAPTVLVGQLARCPQQTLPATLAAGAATEVCELFLLPAGATVGAVDLTPPGVAEPIVWSTTPSS